MPESHFYGTGSVRTWVLLYNPGIAKMANPEYTVQ